MHSRRESDDEPTTGKVHDLEGESFGAWLRSQRIGRGIELRTIADASKISLRYLEALEQDRFEILPAAVFAKGFLRQYSRFVGLDPEEVVNFFMSARRESENEKQPDVVPGRTRSRISTSIFVATVVLVVAGLVLLVGWLADFSQARRDAAVATSGDATGDAGFGGRPVDELAEPALEPGDPPVAEADPSSGEPAPDPGTGGRADAEMPSAEPGAPLRVTLDFTGDCWVEASVDGDSAASGLRVQGESLQLAAIEKVDLKLGNAKMVEIELNGRPFPLTATGTVQRIHIDLDTLRTLAE